MKLDAVPDNTIGPLHAAHSDGYGRMRDDGT